MIRPASPYANGPTGARPTFFSRGPNASSAVRAGVAERAGRGRNGGYGYGRDDDRRDGDRRGGYRRYGYPGYSDPGYGLLGLGYGFPLYNDLGDLLDSPEAFGYDTEPSYGASPGYDASSGPGEQPGYDGAPPSADNSAPYPAQSDSGGGYAAPVPYYPAAPGGYWVQLPAPPPEEDAVTILFKDGRPPEQIRNYALTRTTLYVTGQRIQEIPIDQIDLPSTERVNAEAGVRFQLP